MKRKYPASSLDLRGTIRLVDIVGYKKSNCWSQKNEIVGCKEPNWRFYISLSLKLFHCFTCLFYEEGLAVGVNQKKVLLNLLLNKEWLKNCNFNVHPGYD
jgi:hypothetical protein